jgi:hypothetical protein
VHPEQNPHTIKRRTSAISIISMSSAVMGLSLTTLIILGTTVWKTNDFRGVRRTANLLGELRAGLGYAEIDGSLSFYRTLSDSILLRSLGLEIGIAHMLVPDSIGRYSSNWRFWGLKSFVVPSDRDYFAWHPPNGTVVLVPRGTLTDSFQLVAGSAIWAKQTATDIIVSEKTGRTWTYNSGQLVSIEHPVFGSFSIKCSGTSIREIRNKRTQVVLMEARYSLDGKPTEVLIGGMEALRFEYLGGRLVSISKGASRVVSFQYENGLLSKVLSEGNAALVLSWRTNDDMAANLLGLSKMQLLSDGVNSYQYRLNSDGFHITKVDPIRANRVTTIVNPLSSKIVQYVEGTRESIVYDEQR